MSPRLTRRQRAVNGEIRRLVRARVESARSIRLRAASGWAWIVEVDDTRFRVNDPALFAVTAAGPGGGARERERIVSLAEL